MKSKPLSAAFRLECLLLVYLTCSRIKSINGDELFQTFEVKEGSPAGTVVGTVGNDQTGSLIIGKRDREPPEPPYLIVPQEGFDEGGGGDDLIINEQTGEIRTKRLLDREVTSSYVLNAIPLNGDHDNVRVVINVTDINDNTPTFEEAADDGSMDMDIPENIPPGTIRRLPPALDKVCVKLICAVCMPAAGTTQLIICISYW